jgi:hypothetical protein
MMRRLPYSLARWVEGRAEDLQKIVWPPLGTARVIDRGGRLVVLFASNRDFDYCVSKHPELAFSELG